MQITEEVILELRSQIKPFLKETRLPHVYGVEKQAQELGELFLPTEVNELRVAALLHDITKKCSYDEQLELFEKYKIDVKNVDKCCEKTFHAITGAAVSRDKFRDLVSEQICSGIRWHTTGHKDMTMFETIIFLADFIEPTRTWNDCIVLRNYYYDLLEKTTDYSEKLRALYMTMVKAFELTLIDLKESNLDIDINTIEAKNYFEKMLMK